MSETNIKDYITIGREFENYKWHKPLVTIILSAVIFFILTFVLGAIFQLAFGDISAGLSDSYESLNTLGPASLFSYLILVITIPAIYLASKIVKDRPFSSYASSLGGWRWKLYFKCMAVPLVIYVIFNIASSLTDGSAINIQQISPLMFIAFAITIPLQCIAEEYLFRGLIMQSFGSWFNIPILAIIIQALAFGATHSYNSIGVVTIILGGVVYGLLAWKTNGIEASSALHTINNLTVFITIYFGLARTSTNVDIWAALFAFAIDLICLGLTYYVGSRYNWFESEA
ncbi:CPBP family intramembrane glutamic endopeptidase [uncultured Methanobrevibacter sp.]|uniref:CPBP family intramembrane glutamic endopeptidase n=1 Tax=uncultured Methanobrevibacter sp. TaxID=253161 RepID=UPI0025CF7CF3|nr:CPBP family intramembrane glutamic endopeptidase [uncultured Methanobrevibacter sp.]